MLIRKASDIPSSEITSESVYKNRRHFIQNMTAALGISAMGSILPGCVGAEPLAQQKPGASKYNTSEPLTPLEDVTTYNNYYEFGDKKDQPAKNSKNFKPAPWTVSVEGAVKTPKIYALEDLIKGFTMEERIYRMRCVEKWSMVIPWYGFPLASLIKRLEPTSAAKYVEFVTFADTKQFPNRSSAIDYPYIEGLRMDEAQNELTLLATGVYGKAGPNQNGAPLRLVTPWKYGFKGAKAIAKIRFVEKQPKNTWNVTWPAAYGFYSNVNPNVSHPNWSQADERRIGELELFPRKTLMFNGYTDYVASMYTGMDLKVNY